MKRTAPRFTRTFCTITEPAMHAGRTFVLHGDDGSEAWWEGQAPRVAAMLDVPTVDLKTKLERAGHWDPNTNDIDCRTPTKRWGRDS